jgi:transcription antitermination factor NusG
MSAAAPWFALHIRMHDHANVETALQHKGYEVLSPYYVATRTTPGGREKQVRTPLFPGYLFCSLDPRYRLGVLTVPGVKRILGMGSSMTPVPAYEIEAIRVTINSGLPFEPFQMLEPGEVVEVQRGPLAGVKGIVVYHKGKHRVVITVSALSNRAVSVEVDRADVTRVTNSADVVAVHRSRESFLHSAVA